MLRTLFQQEMIKCGILARYCSSYSHMDSEISQTIEAFDYSLKILVGAIAENNVEKLLIGNAVKPV